MTMKIAMLVAAQIALSTTPALAGEPWKNGAPTQKSIAEEPPYEASARRTRDDADANGDRQYADAPAAGAASGEPKEDLAARERALEDERERQFVERIWTGP